jgi:hypothetical protein
VTKWIIFACFFITFNISKAQKTESDDTPLQKESKNILEREIDFSHKAGKLEDVLQQLSITQNIKFSYSHDRIQNVEVKEKLYISTNIASILTSLLFNSGFNYMVVGRIIVIVEDDKNLNIADPVTEFSEPAKDTVLFHNNVSTIKQDTAGNSSQVNTNKASEIHKINSNHDMPHFNPKIRNHIYSSNANVTKLTPKERRKIQKLYDKELRWVKYHKNFQSTKMDSLDNIKKNKLDNNSTFNPEITSPNYNYYISGSLGFVNYISKIKGNNEFTWNEDLNYHSQIKKSIHPQITLGFISKYFMAGGGIGYQQLKMEESAKAIYKKSNGIGGGIGNQPDTFNYAYSDKYSIFSIPLEILLYKQSKYLFAGLGTKFEVDFIHANGETDKYKTYYTVKVKTGNYSLKTSKTNLAASLKAIGGIMVKKNMAITLGAEYNYYLSYFSKNSVFSFYPHSFQFNLSIFYFFHKNKRILREQ